MPYTEEDIKKAFEAGFYAFQEVDKNYGNWPEAYEQGIADVLKIFMATLTPSPTESSK